MTAGAMAGKQLLSFLKVRRHDVPMRDASNRRLVLPVTNEGHHVADVVRRKVDVPLSAFSHGLHFGSVAAQDDRRQQEAVRGGLQEIGIAQGAAGHALAVPAVTGRARRRVDLGSVRHDPFRRPECHLETGVLQPAQVTDDVLNLRVGQLDQSEASLATRTHLRVRPPVGDPLAEHRVSRRGQEDRVAQLRPGTAFGVPAVTPRTGAFKNDAAAVPVAPRQKRLQFATIPLVEASQVVDQVHQVVFFQMLPEGHGRTGMPFHEGRVEILVVDDGQEGVRVQRRAQGPLPFLAVARRAVRSIKHLTDSQGSPTGFPFGQLFQNGLLAGRSMLPGAQERQQVADFVGRQVLPTGHGRVGPAVDDRPSQELVRRNRQQRCRTQCHSDAAPAV